jgi:hypothetical protein
MSESAKQIMVQHNNEMANLRIEGRNDALHSNSLPDHYRNKKNVLKQTHFAPINCKTSS